MPLALAAIPGDRITLDRGGRATWLPALAVLSILTRKDAFLPGPFAAPVTMADFAQRVRADFIRDPKKPATAMLLKHVLRRWLGTTVSRLGQDSRLAADRANDCYSAVAAEGGNLRFLLAWQAVLAGHTQAAGVKLTPRQADDKLLSAAADAAVEWGDPAALDTAARTRIAERVFAERIKGWSSKTTAEQVRAALADNAFRAEAEQALAEAWARRPGAEVVAAAHGLDRESLEADRLALLEALWEASGEATPDVRDRWQDWVELTGGWYLEPFAKAFGYTAFDTYRQTAIGPGDEAEAGLPLLDQTICGRVFPKLDRAGGDNAIFTPARDLILAEARRAAGCFGLEAPAHRATIALCAWVADLIDADYLLAVLDERGDRRFLLALPEAVKQLVTWVAKAAGRDKDLKRALRSASGGDLSEEESLALGTGLGREPGLSAVDEAEIGRAGLIAGMRQAVLDRLWKDVYGHDLRGAGPTPQQTWKDIKSALTEGPGDVIAYQGRPWAKRASRAARATAPGADLAAAMELVTGTQQALGVWWRAEPEAYDAVLDRVGLHHDDIFKDICREASRGTGLWTAAERRAAWEAYLDALIAHGPIVADARNRTSSLLYRRSHGDATDVVEVWPNRPEDLADYTTLEWFVHAHANLGALSVEGGAR